MLIELLRVRIDRMEERLLRVEREVRALRADLGQPVPTVEVVEDGIDTKQPTAGDPGQAITVSRAVEQTPPSESATAPTMQELSAMQAAATVPFAAPARTLTPAAIVSASAPAPFASQADEFSIPAEPPAERDRGSWEAWIGTRWAAWAGAISIVLAVGFFVKLAVDEGWFGRLAPEVKCLLTALFGGVLLVAGEIALRRISRIAAVGLYGAGLGTLFVTAFASFRWFELVPQTGAFWLMFVVAIIGVAVSLRARMLTTAILALLGGYTTPVLLSGASTFAGALPLYISTLLGIALLLSAAYPRPFRPLRYVALALHVLVATLWLLKSGSEAWPIGLVALGVWWLAVNGEAYYAARRGQSPIGNAIVSMDLAAWIALSGIWLLNVARLGDSKLIGSFILALCPTPPEGQNWLGLFAATLAAMAAIPAGLLGPGIKVLRRSPRRALERLMVAFWAQTGVFLAVAIGLQFEGCGITVGWLVLGLACVEVGRHLPSRGVDWFGLLVGAAALCRVAMFDSHLSELDEVFVSFAGVQLKYFGLLLLGATLCVYVSALRLQVHGSPPRVWLPVALTGIGTLGVIMACATQCTKLTSHAVTWGWLAAGLVLIASEPLARRMRTAFFGTVLLWLAAIKFVLLDMLAEMSSVGWDPTVTLPIINETFLLGLIIAVGFAGRAWQHFGQANASDVRLALRRRRRAERTVIYAAFFLLLVFAGQLHHGIARYLAMKPAMAWPPEIFEQLWQIVMWTAGGLTVVLVAQWQQWRMVQSAGWFLLLVGAISWLSLGTLWPRLESPAVPAPVVLNVQFFAGVLIAGMLALAARPTGPRRGHEQICGLALIVVIGLWLGSFEIDRYCVVNIAGKADANMARQTALSIFWALYAISLIAIGFVKRTAPIRYTGLALLTVTLGKVLFVDLAEVRYVYRVLSFLGVGLLLMLTSVAYAKLTQRLAPVSEGDMKAEDEVGNVGE